MGKIGDCTCRDADVKGLGVYFGDQSGRIPANSNLMRRAAQPDCASALD